MGPIVVGIDVGQKRDPTAIAVAELEERHDGDHHVIRLLERLPLRTPYPEIAQRVATIVGNLQARMQHEEAERQLLPRWQRPPSQRLAPTVYVDATGVGQPVVDLLAQAGVELHAVYFTDGDRRKVDGRQISLGKAWLVSRLQALLQTGRILLPVTAEARTLAKELQDYEIKVDQDANDRYGAFRVGTHDDLVTALGLAVQPAVQDIAPLDPQTANLIMHGWQQATYGS